jgi:hypothetical protein
MKTSMDHLPHHPPRPSSFLSIDQRHPPHNHHHSSKQPSCRPAPNNNSNNNNMPPRDPSTMPEFKLIDGWHIAVSQPVHNPAALAIERAKAAAALLPPGPKYIDNAVARTSAVFADAGALSDKELPAAKAEKDVCCAGGSGYVYIELLKLYGEIVKLTLCE